MIGLEEFGVLMKAQDPLIADVVEGPPGKCLIVKRLMFHWTLLLNEIGDDWQYERRWCYRTQELAERAAAEWKSRDFADGPRGWHKDVLNEEYREAGWGLENVNA